MRNTNKALLRELSRRTPATFHLATGHIGSSNHSPPYLRYLLQ